MSDVVQIGGATLYHGDCEDIVPAIDHYDSIPLADVLVTDPPYGIYGKGGKWGRKKELEWDQDIPEDMLFYLMRRTGNQIIWGGNYYSLPPSRGWLIWHKRDSVPSAADVEMAWTSYDMNSKIIDCTIASTNKERNGHPTLKPLRVMRWCLTFVKTAPNVIVIDPFMGSGTTGVACVMDGRKFIGIEKELKYFDIACERIDAGYAQGRLAL